MRHWLLRVLLKVRCRISLNVGGAGADIFGHGAANLFVARVRIGSPTRAFNKPNYLFFHSSTAARLTER
ncbi:MAG TPA: hypothetical protein VNT76_05450, partial [Candidatus Binatus sp.]|nr:hypothetical protein [Candidatus Binatus sp.]